MYIVKMKQVRKSGRILTRNKNKKPKLRSGARGFRGGKVVPDPEYSLNLDDYSNEQELSRSSRKSPSRKSPSRKNPSRKSPS